MQTHCMLKVDISAENRLVQIHKPFLATDVYPEILLLLRFLPPLQTAFVPIWVFAHLG